MSTASNGALPYPFHKDPGVIVITRDVTRPRRGQVKARPPQEGSFDRIVIEVQNEVVGTVPGARVELPCRGFFKTHQVAAFLGRTSDGTLYVYVTPYFEAGANTFFSSADEGRSWMNFPIRQPQVNSLAVRFNLFVVLPDDSFMAVSGGDGQPLVFWRSLDRGRSWERLGQIKSDPFEVAYQDGKLLPLRDGSLLFPVQFGTLWKNLSAAWKTPLNSNPMWQQYAQYMMRSFDGGRTWRNAPDPALWRPLLENHLTTVTVSPLGRTPGPGGTYPGCWETGLLELAEGDILAALRYSGRPDPWHPSMADRWNALVGDPGPTGRIYRHVMLARSHDGGDTWKDFGPVVDAAGEPLLIYGESNGELVQLPDGRVVLIHQRRAPRGSELIARLSEDAGRTWLPEEYRLHAGFGYTSSIVLADGAVITATGSTKCDTNSVPVEPPGAVVIRWKPLPREQRTPS